MKLYNELAHWWPLLSPLDDYAQEADFFASIFSSADLTIQTMLELGSGGGNNAYHMKQHYLLTLTDLSPAMLEVSRTINPELEHIQGDMRTLRLDRVFDAVFIHDAIEYMLTENDLRQAMETAYVHLKPGGMALFVPDHVRETFAPMTDCGGSDGDGRGLRYMEWVYDPDPTDTTVAYHLTYMLREGETMTVEHDPHVTGLFGQDDWLRLLGEVGLKPRVIVDPEDRVIFAGNKP